MLSAALATASFVAAYWHWMLLLGGTSIALAYVAFLQRNWRLAAGAAALVALIVCTAYLDQRGYQRKTAEVVAAVKRQQEARLALQEEILRDYEATAARDATEIDALRAKAETTPDSASACLDQDAARRIGGVK